MPTTTHTTTTRSPFDTNNLGINTNNSAPVLPPYLRTSSQSPLHSFPFSPSNNLPSAIGTGIKKEKSSTKMAVDNSEIMDFVNRYQNLQGYQNASDQLMKVCLRFPLPPWVAIACPPLLPVESSASFPRLVYVCRETKASYPLLGTVPQQSHPQIELEPELELFVGGRQLLLPRLASAPVWRWRCSYHR